MLIQGNAQYAKKDEAGSSENEEVIVKDAAKKVKAIVAICI